MGPDSSNANAPDWVNRSAFDQVQGFRQNYPYASPDLEDQKPFMQGEANSFAAMSYGTERRLLEEVFHNYDVAFHNELWTGAFSGKFATGLTWHWSRLFWWPLSLPQPPNDFSNVWDDGVFSSDSGATNTLDLGVNGGHSVLNKPVLHNIKPIADMMSHPDVAYLLHDVGSMEPQHIHDTSAGLECYYMKGWGSLPYAVGWVHNLSAWEMNSYYLGSLGTAQNFLGCVTPNAQAITLPGFQQDEELHLTWFPTRMNAPVPPDATVTANAYGEVALDFSALQMNGIANNYIDTLHSDYAFVLSPQPVLRRADVPNEQAVQPSTTWDFTMFPNPATDVLHVQMQANVVANELVLFDLNGKRVLQRSGPIAPSMDIPTGHLSKGSYAVMVTAGVNTKIRILIIN